MSDRIVKLGTTGTETTAVGFGGAHLVRLPIAAKRAQVLCAAYDGSVRHFDVAPTYGLGYPDSETGRLARGRGDTITVATKFGTRLARRPRRSQRTQKAPQLSFLILAFALIASRFIVAEGL